MNCSMCRDTGVIPDPDRGSGNGPYWDDPCQCEAGIARRNNALAENAGSTPAAQEAAEAVYADDTRTIFEGVRIATDRTIFEPDHAEQDDAGWWFEFIGRPTFVPHHAVVYLQFTAPDNE